MQSRQHQPPDHQKPVPPLPTTLWHRLPTSNQQQLALRVAELVLRVKRSKSGKENEHEH